MAGVAAGPPVFAPAACAIPARPFPVAKRFVKSRAGKRTDPAASTVGGPLTGEDSEDPAV